MGIWIIEKVSGKNVHYEVKEDIVIGKYQGKMKLDYMKKQEEGKK